MGADASEEARHNGLTIDVRGGAGDGVPLIKSCVSGGVGEVKTWMSADSLRDSLGIVEG